MRFHLYLKILYHLRNNRQSIGYHLIRQRQEQHSTTMIYYLARHLPSQMKIDG